MPERPPGDDSPRLDDLSTLAPPVGIPVADEADGGELVECLWRHGFPASLVESDAGWRVEVRSPHEDTSRLVADLYEAIARWRPDAAVEPRPLSGTPRGRRPRDASA